MGAIHVLLAACEAATREAATREAATREAATREAAAEPGVRNHKRCDLDPERCVLQRRCDSWW